MVIDNIFLHNIAWSRYRRDLFAEISKSCAHIINFQVIQMAKNESARKSFCQDIGLEHRYSEKILSNKFYEQVGLVEYIKLICTLFSTNYDVLTVSGYGSLESWIGLLVTKIKRKKIVVAIDSWEPSKSKPKNYLKRFFLKSSSAALSYGTKSRRMLVDLGMKQSSIFYPFHNVRNEFYNLPDSCDSQHDVENKPFIFTFVGRLSTEKCVLELVHAFEKFTRLNYGNQEFVLLIAGSGELYSTISKLLLVYGLRSKIKMLGALETEDLIKLYDRSGCLILPSLYEPWGLVVNEALCCGCPVLVSSNCGCIEDLCADSEFSIVFDLQDRNIEEHIFEALQEAYRKFSFFDLKQARKAKKLGNKFSLSSAASVYRDAITSLY